MKTKTTFNTKTVTLCLIINSLSLFLWGGTEVFGAALTLNNNGYLVINKGAYLVINTSGTDGITTLGTGGNIISETDTNRVKWNIGTATGTYNIPFSYTDGSKIPFVFNVTSAGTGSGNLTVSTYYTDVAATPNNRPLPVGVTDLNSNGSENDVYVLDRFWRVNMNNYTVNPSASIDFTYRELEWNTARNTISEPTLQAQQWLGGGWQAPVGTDNPATNTVSVTGINTSGPWTLVSNVSPLPIELIWFKARWLDENYTTSIIEWRTAAEINIDHFDVQRSLDGSNFTTIIYGIKARNSSTQISDYQELDRDPNHDGVSYYRLKIVDYDGKVTYSNIVPLTTPFGLDILDLYANPAVDEITAEVVSSLNSDITISITNVLGQSVKQETNAVEIGKNHFKINLRELSSGYYYLIVTTSSGMYRDCKQFVIGDKSK